MLPERRLQGVWPPCPKVDARYAAGVAAEEEEENEGGSFRGVRDDVHRVQFRQHGFPRQRKIRAR